MIKLHLGCGKRKIHGWTNIDVDPSVNPDSIDRAEELKGILDNSVSMIYASHLLEHYKRKETKNILRVWYKKLLPGGVLRVAVPDFAKVVEAYSKRNIPLMTLLGFLVGGQRNEFDNHYMEFDFKLMSEYLADVGFVNIKQYNWQDTEHFYVDDYASCYLPHLDKGSGLLMSLNVECEKPK